ncbi:MAG: alpha/beta hydrolase [Rhodospirillaceae bacterium]
MPITKVSGGDVHYECHGQGAPVVMVLPSSSGPVGPGPFADTLAERFMVIRYDPLGSGRSSPAPSPRAVSMAARAREVIGVLDALAIKRAYLCCHSTGCGIGLAAAAGNPERIGGLVLISPWTHADGHLTVIQNLRIAAVHALGPREYERFNANLLFPPAYRRRHEAGFDRLAETAKQQDAERFADRLIAILAFDARPILPTIACPTLVVTDVDDQLMPVWFGRDMARDIPGAALIELADGGHMLPETHGRELAARVADFLGRIEPA